jgi:hypothetical protein
LQSVSPGTNANPSSIEHWMRGFPRDRALLNSLTLC